MSIITLTSDFGNKDYSVPAWKGKLLNVSTETQIVDITHDVTPYSIEEAAYLFRAVYREFPNDTIHFLSVYDYYQSANHMLFFEHGGQFFAGPDNGLFSLIFDDLPKVFYQVPLAADRPFAIQNAFAVIYEGLNKNIPLESIGAEVDSIAMRLSLHPVISKDQLRGSVVYLDRYGNATVNINRDLFNNAGQGREFKLYFKRFDPITEIHEHHMQAEIGAPLCTFNSQGFLEISINLERADHMLGLKKGDAIQIEFLTDEE
jgi:S-adenosylmethionine hydrolase